jgi:hypothetical protein
MKPRQRESAAKYLYDMSKGIALVTVVSALATGQWSVFTLSLGAFTTLVFFFWAYWLDGADHD